MNYEVNKRFIKQFSKLNNKEFAIALNDIFKQVESAKKILDISNIKKLKGFQTCYRIRYGDYRIGIVYKDNTVFFIAIAHRKDIYNIFP